MIKYMVVGLPRSGTAWWANLLSTDGTHCYHDWLRHTTLEVLESSSIPYGLSDTSLITLGSDELNKLDCRKLVIHRPLDQIHSSLYKQGLYCNWAILNNWSVDLHNTDGFHIHYDLLPKKNSREIQRACEYLGITRPIADIEYLLDFNIQDQSSIDFTREALKCLQS